MPFSLTLPTDLTTLPNSDLQETLNILEGLYNLYRANKNHKMMKVIKAILEQLRMEDILRFKKVKATDRRTYIGKLKSDELKKVSKQMWKKVRLQIIEDAMKKDVKSGEFYRFAEKVRLADPAVQQSIKLQQDRELIAQAKDYLHTIRTCSDPLVKSLALTHFDNFARKHKKELENLDESLLNEKWKHLLKKGKK